MKKIITLFAITLMMVGLVACNSKKNNTSETTTTTSESTKKTDVTIGFVTDVGGIDDKSFNQTSYEGVKKFAAEYGLEEGKEIKYLTSKTETDYVPNLTTFVNEGTDLIAAAGFLFEKSITEVAKANPDQKMLIIDVDWIPEDVSPNLLQASFAENEGSFLVGVAAAKKALEAGKDTLGIIVGGSGVIMDKFEAGYQAGIWAVCPTCKILTQNINSFVSAETGKTAAAKQYTDGAYAVYHVAGGSGIGVIQEATDRRDRGEDVWAIGVDTDQYELGKYGDNKSSVLTSMLKGVQTATYKVSKSVAEGTFKGGKLYLSLKDGGVSLPEKNPNLSDEIMKLVEEYSQKIISGEITVPTTPKRPNESELVIG